MRKLWIAAAALALAALPALAAEATFERTLSVSGRVELSVSTGSGNIHITRGTGNQVHIWGKVKSGWGGSEQRVREIAAHPPVEQTGNIIRIGSHHENMHNISIDYEIQAPENSFLDAGSGSGDITDDGVGENAKIHTGSGNIHATSLHGGFKVDTGSGNIYVDQTGQGDVNAQTGSGNIELRNLHGGLHAAVDHGAKILIRDLDGALGIAGRAGRAGGRCRHQVGGPGAAIGSADLEQIHRRDFLGPAGIGQQGVRHAFVEKFFRRCGHAVLRVVLPIRP